MRKLFPQPVNKIRFPGLINSAGRALVCGQEQGCSYVFRGCSSVPFSVVKGCVSPCTCADECGHQQTASGVQVRCNPPFAVLKNELPAGQELAGQQFQGSILTSPEWGLQYTPTISGFSKCRFCRWNPSAHACKADHSPWSCSPVLSPVCSPASAQALILYIQELFLNQKC